MALPAPPLTTSASLKTLIGAFETNGESDVFQILGPGNSVVCGMNKYGVIYNTVGNFVVSVAPLTASIDVTAAQLKALHTTPVVLVPSPGPGQYITPLQFAFQFNYVAPQFTETGADGSLYFGWGTTANAVTTNYAANPGYSDTILATQSMFRTNPIDSFATALTNIVNQPLSLGMLDTLATGAGNLKVSLAYYIVVA